MYPGAMTVLIPRILFVALSVLLVAIFCRLFLIGQDLEKPVSGFRRFLIKWMFQFITRFGGLVGFFAWFSHDVVSHTDSRVDYSEWLGPEWRKELDEHMKKNEADSMLVCNHNGLFDIMCHLTSPLLPSFTPLV